MLVELRKSAPMQAQIRTSPDVARSFLHNVAIRGGLFTGFALCVVFAAWLYVANRRPEFEHFALQRNLVAASVLGLIAAIPVLRFLRSPGNLLSAGLVGWSLFALFYGALCVQFRSLDERCGPLQLFMLGALLYMILATVSWLGTCIWRARASHVAHPSHHHVN
jgi:uncharacterized membrane protein YvlD (DUF360 family)